MVKAIDYPLDQAGPGAMLDGSGKLIWSPEAKDLYSGFKASLVYESGLSVEQGVVLWRLLDAKRSSWFIKGQKRDTSSIQDEVSFCEAHEYHVEPFDVVLANEFTFGHFMAIHYGIWFDALPILRQFAADQAAVVKKVMASEVVGLDVPHREDGSFGSFMWAVEMTVKAQFPMIGDAELTAVVLRARHAKNKAKLLHGAGEDLEAAIELRRTTPKILADMWDELTK